jgi:hypothetical protein
LPTTFLINKSVRIAGGIRATIIESAAYSLGSAGASTAIITKIEILIVNKKNDAMSNIIIVCKMITRKLTMDM